MTSSVDVSFFHATRPGHVWSVWKGVVRHVGIETLAGTIISASPNIGGVAETSKHEFAGDQCPKHKGFPGNLSAWQVEARARSLIGQAYSVWKNNCEHFVNEAHGLNRVSPQLQAWATAGVVLLISFAVFSVAKKRVA